MFHIFEWSPETKKIIKSYHPDHRDFLIARASLPHGAFASDPHEMGHKFAKMMGWHDYIMLSADDMCMYSSAIRADEFQAEGFMHKDFMTGAIYGFSGFSMHVGV
jgi:hypothetical protein